MYSASQGPQRSEKLGMVIRASERYLPRKNRRFLALRAMLGSLTLKKAFRRVHAATGTHDSDISN